MGMQNAKVTVIGENSYEWVLTYLAVVNSSNVIVPIDREAPPEEIKKFLVASGVETLVFSDTYADIAAYLQKSSVAIRHYINMDITITSKPQRMPFTVNSSKQATSDIPIKTDFCSFPAE